MSEYQDIKGIVLDFYRELDAAQDGNVENVLNKYVTDNEYHWRGMHPFYEKFDTAAVAKDFWLPLKESFSTIQRRQDVFMAGSNDCDQKQTDWVCSMGHLMGLFDKPWLGIPASGKMAFLRYVEFNKVENGKITETALFLDIINLMQQVGQNPLPMQTGAFLITPGPRTHDGLMFGPQDPAEGKKTLDLINRMVSELNSTDEHSALHSPQEELRNTWHDDMIWFGPGGIGATFTLPRYEEQHQGPFSAGLDDIQFNGHICRFGEGNFGGFFGWANLSMTPSGNFMGLPAGHRSEMRVVDIYRREGDKLAENWIFIDILHFLSKQGLNVLERMQKINRT